MRKAMFAFLLIIAPLTTGTAFAAEDWPPKDPHEYVTKTAFTVAWAKTLIGFKTLDQLQRAAGSRGTISERKLDGAYLRVSFHWRSDPDNGNVDRLGYMLATVTKGGDIGVSILTDDNTDFVLNSFGSFICDKCSPPIEYISPTDPWGSAK